MVISVLLNQYLGKVFYLASIFLYMFWLHPISIIYVPVFITYLIKTLMVNTLRFELLDYLMCICTTQLQLTFKP